MSELAETPESASSKAGEATAGGAERGRTAVVTLACIAAIGAFGTALFFTSDPMLTFGPLAGIVAAFGVRRRLDASAVAFAGVLLGTACAALVSEVAWA